MFSKLFAAKPIRLGYFPIESQGESGTLSLRWRNDWRPSEQSLMAIALMSISMSVCLLGVVAFGLQWQIHQLKTEMPADIYSPFLEKHPSAAWPRPVQFDARLHHPTAYAGPPSPDVEDLWMNLAVNFTPVFVPESMGRKAGLEGSALIHRKDKDGNDELGYFATVEAFHQLHCLDLLRKVAHPNYEYYSRQGEPMFHDNELYQLRTHVGHCVDILRQRLTCNPDYALIGYNYVEGLDYPVPNFPAVEHSCHDLSTLLKWTEERAVRQLRLEDLVDRRDRRITVLGEIP